MSYTFEQLKEDVRKEAVALKQNATKEELGKLDIDVLNPEMPDRCIYGQMANGCYTKRAADLIKICTPKFVRQLYEVSDNGIEGLKDIEVSESEPFFIRDRTSVNGGSHAWSPIELYILLPEANNANLIAYLRGETENLDL